jgi:soluble lytic murein transglycosylase-like protein
MKAICIARIFTTRILAATTLTAMTLAVVSTPAFAGKARHHKHASHHHVARDAAPGQGAYSSMVARHAAANGIPASLVHRVIMRESRYNPRAVSKGNYGMMQIKLGTARAMGYTGSAAGLLDPETNMTYAVKYLAGAYKVAGGSESGAVANYARGYYHSAKRRGVSPYEAPGAQAFAMQPFAMQPTVVMQTSTPARSSRRAARVNSEFYVRTPSDRHAVF